MPDNYYDILNIEKTATQNEIKKAYRKLAILYHPDKSSGYEERFKEISEAYSVLSDTFKRSQYDVTGFAELNIQDPMEIFETLFSDFQPDIFYNLTDTIKESINPNIQVKTFVCENNFSENNFSEKLNTAIPDMLNTFKNVITGQEDENPLKESLMKNLIKTTNSIFQDSNNFTIYDDSNKGVDDSNKGADDFNNDLDVNNNLNVNNNLDVKMNMSKDNNLYKNISMTKDIRINKNFSLKDFYLEKTKTFKYNRIEIEDDVEKKVVQKISVPLFLNKEIYFKGMGHHRKRNNDVGDMYFNFNYIEHELFQVKDYDLFYNLDIKISDLYGDYMTDITLLDESTYNLEYNDLYKSDDLNKNDLTIKKENLGLPIPLSKKRGSLNIKLNLIFKELSEQEIESIKNIFN
tara:strand:- start:132 stop:1346 length:1215 start_codon:yes stop_codon:yes gene_type:complete